RLETKDSWLERHQYPKREKDDPLENEMVLNLGPQHPATHGVLRVVVKLDGELIEKAVVDIGYLHRGLEKLAESKTFQEFMVYTDRMDYLAPYSNNVAWCLAVEKLAAIEVPERAQWIRMIFCELARISSHLLWLGVGLMDAGAVSVFHWAFQYREDIYKIYDELGGQRFYPTHSRIGGVMHDLTPTVLAMVRVFTERFPEALAGWEKLLNRNRIWIDRNEGIGLLTAEEAIELGMTGPCLRGSGVARDIRRFEPYLRYEDVDFNIPIRSEGDSLARYFVRMEEMREHPHHPPVPRPPARRPRARRQREEGLPVEGRGLLLDGGHDPRLPLYGRRDARAEGRRGLPRRRGAEGRAGLLPPVRRHGPPLPHADQRPVVHQPPGSRIHDGRLARGRHGHHDRLHRPGH